MNDRINRKLSSIHYISVGTAVKWVVELGLGIMMAKVTSNMPTGMYRSIQMTDTSGKGQIRIDKVLPFCFALHPKSLPPWLIHLSGFFVTQGWNGTSITLTTFLQQAPQILKIQPHQGDLGFPLKWGKVEGSTCVRLHHDGGGY